MKKTQKSLSLLLFILLPLQMTNAEEHYRFHEMSPAGGLSYDGISQTAQDSKGFIWVLQSNELYRFDGYSYKRYKTYFSEIDNNSEWHFNSILTGDNGIVYVNTNHGLFEYHTDTDKFLKVEGDGATGLLIDLQNNLWYREENVLYLKSSRNPGEEVKPINTSGKVTRSLSKVSCFHEKDLFLFSNYGMVYKYDPKRRELDFCVRTPDSTLMVLAAHAQSGEMWILNTTGVLYKYDISTFNLDERIELPMNFSKMVRRDYHFDKRGVLWIATLDGLYAFNPKTKQLTHLKHNPNNPYSIANNSIWSIDEDRQGNLWIGAYSGVLQYLNFDDPPIFQTFTPKNSMLSFAPVSTFAENDGFIWVGTEGGGLNRMNKQSGEFNYFDVSSNSTGIASKNIKSIVIDNNDHLWVGTYQGGIDHLNMRGEVLRNYRKLDDPNSLRVNNIRKLVLEPDSGIWIAYQQNKLEISFYSFFSKQFTHYDFTEGRKDAFVFDMLRGPANQLWILTKENLYKFNVISKELEDLPVISDRFANFSTMTFDDSGDLWIGTLDNGLIQYNPSTKEVYEHRSILQHNVTSIFNILYNDGRLWIGTDNGLLVYDIRLKEIIHFNEYDGVQGSLFYPLAALKGDGNKFYLGGTNGFTIVDSELMQKNTFKPTVIISEFLIDYVPGKLQMEKRKNGSYLKLNYKQSNFGFRFASDNYLNPEKVYYKFRLKGYNDQWVEVDATNRTAFYSKVPPGTYYFEIVASNSHGVWNEEPTVLKIVRKPAPWASKFAYFLYALLVGLLVYYFWQHKRKQEKLEMQLYLDNLDREKKEEIHQSQLTFFTNISHDFRTPLSLILASLERAREEGLKEYFYHILNSNAQRLLNLVNELMDFRTVENSKMQLELWKIDVNTLVKELAADFDDFAVKKNITFRIVCDESLPNNIYVDPNVLEKVIMNLLNNAFKYTHEGGTVIIETHTKPYESVYSASYTVNEECKFESGFMISVRDNGVGISKESISTVFERFYKVKTNNQESHLGTGVGLALVKSLVLLHRGSITISSERDKGTDMLVCFSTDKNTYDSDQFAAVSDSNISDEDFVIKSDILEDDLAEIDSLDDVYDDSIPQKLKKKVLFVEDNEELRKLVADSLSDDYEVFEAADGLYAEEILAEQSIDIIISDIMMPRKDGITLCYDVKSNIETSHIPVILLTAKTSVESKLEGSDTGADIYLEKPISLELLKSNMTNIFKQRQLLKEYYARNHYADSAELGSNERDTLFLQQFVDVIEKHMAESYMDVDFLAAEMSMSRSKLYRKIKTMTDMSIVEFVLSYKLKKAARLLIEEDMSMREIMEIIGIESQPYFTNAFKKEYGETPTAFAAKHKA